MPPCRIACALFALALVAPVARAAEPAAAPSAPARPNILLLIADDLGWTDLSTGRTNGGRGSKYHQTPQIDRLAEEGISFTAAYAMQQCTPSRATLHSAQFPVRHWVYSVGGFENVPPERRRTLRLAPPSGRREDLAARTYTVAESLRDAGYRTHIVGKVHGLGPRHRLDANHGFDVQLAVSKRTTGSDGKEHHYHSALKGDRWRFERDAFDPFATPYLPDYIAKHLAPIANGNDPARLAGKPKHLTDAIADATIRTIRNNARRGGPFFIETAFHAVHRPIRPRADLAAKYRAIPSKDERHTDADYAALVEQLDQSVGRILAALDDPNGDGDPKDSLRDDTLVIFLSDNGGYYKNTSSAPLRGSKGSFFEGGIRVPLIARLPGTTKPGSTSDAAVSIADLFPTFAELAGSKLPPRGSQPIDGESLVPILAGNAQRLARPALYWHYPGYSGHGVNPSAVINRRHRGKRYKLTWHYDEERYTLFDLEEDIGERKNLLEKTPTGVDREAAERLSSDLHTWVRVLKAPRGWVRRTNTRVKAPPLLDYPDEQG